ncbi:Rho guanine nucleotide exchange factor 4 [Nowakowskiella sp. JEL0078]|nr:Rho guanine nucleotide exchange factor 4 [Nowakowskiella sp. JEL0078]
MDVHIVSVSVDASSSVNSRLCATALWDYVPIEDNELEFKAGDIIDVLALCNEDWYQGQLGESIGYFPANRVKLIKGAEETSQTEVTHQNTDPIQNGYPLNETVSSDMVSSSQQRTLSVITDEANTSNQDFNEKSSPTLEIIPNYISSEDIDVDQPILNSPLQINIIEPTPTNNDIIVANLISVRSLNNVDPFAGELDDLSSYYFVANSEIQPEDVKGLNIYTKSNNQDLNITSNNKIPNKLEDFVEITSVDVKSEQELLIVNSDTPPCNLKLNATSEISPTIDQIITDSSCVQPIVDDQIVPSQEKDWIEVTNEEGQTYFWNIVTQETSWTHPDQNALKNSDSADSTPLQTIYNDEEEVVETETAAKISNASAASLLSQNELKSSTLSVETKSAVADFDPVTCQIYFKYLKKLYKFQQSIDLVPSELIRREGYLSVKGKKQNSNSGASGTWKSYWAVVCVGFLIFYKEQSSKLKVNHKKYFNLGV